MSEFSPEELLDSIDRHIVQLLKRQGWDEPPVDALRLVEEVFGYAIEYLDEDEDQEGSHQRGRRGRTLRLRMDLSPTGQNAQAARACAREMIPGILEALGVAPGTQQRGANTQLIGLIAPRLLLPTRWFDRDARRCSEDLERLKERYGDVPYEWLALRLLDRDEPSVVAIVDDGIVATRRGCLIATTKKLTAAEELCLERVVEAREAVTVRKEGWTCRGWPIPDGPFRRIILRSVPDDV
jgi:hypothetical protein